METGQIIYYVAILTLVGMAVVSRAKFHGWSKTAQMAAVWIVIIAMLIAMATYWDDLKNSKFMANLIPGNAIENEDGSMSFMRADGGHFFVNTEVNGETIKFLLDTGATNISFSKEDAKKIGVNPDDLVYSRRVYTANGESKAAPFRIKTMKVGSLILTDLQAHVGAGEMNDSLLGMTFLNKMKSYKVEGSRLTIYP